MFRNGWQGGRLPDLVAQEQALELGGWSALISASRKPAMRRAPPTNAMTCRLIPGNTWVRRAIVRQRTFFLKW